MRTPCTALQVFDMRDLLLVLFVESLIFYSQASHAPMSASIWLCLRSLLWHAMHEARLDRQFAILLVAQRELACSPACQCERVRCLLLQITSLVKETPVRFGGTSLW